MLALSTGPERPEPGRPAIAAGSRGPRRRATGAPAGRIGGTYERAYPAGHGGDGGVNRTAARDDPAGSRDPGGGLTGPRQLPLGAGTPASARGASGAGVL